MIRTSVLGVSAFALLTAAACAQEDPAADANPEMKTQTEAQILDASQVTTREEAKLLAKSEFKQADLNGDGNVDEGEFIAYASVRAPMTSTAEAAPAGEAQGDAEVADAGTAEEQFAKISNGGEAITETQLAEARVEQFDEADANDDETLDTQERVQFASLATPKPSESPL